MKQLLRACLALMLTPLWAAPPPTIAPSEISPGMKGYGLTVFHGTTIEKFDVEVLGVLPFADLDDDWIMVRITSGPVAERGSGVVGGMSGSPVFIGERLAGAVAFGYPLPRESVCFLQPIGQMMRALDRANAPLTLASDGEVRRLERPLTVLGRTVDRVRIGSRAESAGELVAEPLATPLAVSGLGASGLDWLKRGLAPYHLALQASPAGRESGTTELVPGAALGVLLVDGDIRAAGTGTLTWRDGDRVLAFGHPMLQRGRVAMPLCGAKIIDFFNGIERSDKVSVALDPVGTLEADTRWAIAGRLGAAPAMVPVKLHLSDTEAGWRRDFGIKVLNDPQLAPALAFNLLGAMVDGQCGEMSKVAFTAHSVVRFAGRPAIDRQRSGYIASGGAVVTLAEVMSAVRLALAAPFDDLRLEGIELTVELSHRDPTATIARARFARQQVKPGESMSVDLDLRQRADGKMRTVTVELPIPANVAPGRYRLALAGGAQAAALNQQLGAMPLPATNTSQVLARIAEQPTDDLALVAKLALNTSDIGIRGQRLPSPPAHIEQLLNRGQTTDLSRARNTLTTTLPVDLLVTNALTAEVTVLDPLTGEPPRSAPPSGGGDRPEPGGDGPPPGGGGPEGRPAMVIDQLAQPAATDPLAPWLSTPLWLRSMWGEPMAWDLGASPRPAPQAVTPDPGPARPEPAKPAAGPKPDAPKGAEPPAGGPSPAAARAPKSWLLSSAKDFAPGDVEGATLTPQGTLLLAAGSEQIAAWPEPHLLAADTDRAGVTWLGGGSTGQLLKLAGGKLDKAWSSDDPLVTAVAATNAGVLFASAPSGQIRRLAADGSAKDVAATDCAYVWQLREARDGSMLAVTGGPSRVLRLTGDKLQPLASAEVDHLLCVAEAPNGTVYAGGGQPGRLFRIEGGRAVVVATAADPVTALAVGADGTVYFGHGGAVSALSATGERRLLAGFAGSRVLSILPLAQGLLVSASLRADGHTALFMVEPKDGQATAVFDEKLAGVTAVVAQSDGSLLAVGDAPARVYKLRLPCGAKGTYTSPVLDAGGRSRWGSFEVGLAEGSAGTITVEARSGDTPKPTDDWTPWLPVLGKPVCGPGRFLQYRLLMAAGDGKSPQVESTRLDYVLINTEPKVTIEAPAPGTAWKGKQDVRWKVSDAEGDPVISTILVKADGAREWQPLAEGLAPGLTTFALDPSASKLKDGPYRLRLVVDDVLLNPTDPRSGSATTEPFWIDNTAPTVLLAEKLVAGDCLDFRLNASDNHRLASVEWRADGKPWRAATPLDGLIDSGIELVAVKSQTMPPGKHLLEVRARDVAGNETVVKREVTR